jgi:uncharacterized SAM-binding protein YcdF (DUF218 family)
MGRLLTFIGIILIILISIIPLRLAITSHITPRPQVIFTLGGGSVREEFTAEIAKYYPDLDVWISSGVEKQESQRTFQQAGIAENRIHRDYSATDTVTNFTSLIDKFQQRNIHHVFLVTSDFHMPRAKAIATLVLGSRGITFTPLPVPSNKPKESTTRIIRDSVRSILWIFSGRTAANLNPNLSPQPYAFRPLYYRYI